MGSFGWRRFQTCVLPYGEEETDRVKVRQWDGGNGFECSKPFMAEWKRSWEVSEVEDRSDHHQPRECI